MKSCALRSSHFILGTYLISVNSSFWVVAVWFFAGSSFANRFLFSVMLQSVSALGHIAVVIFSLYDDILKDVFYLNALQFRNIQGSPLILRHTNRFNCYSALQVIFTRFTNTRGFDLLLYTVHANLNITNQNFRLLHAAEQFPSDLKHEQDYVSLNIFF